MARYHYDLPYRTGRLYPTEAGRRSLSWGAPDSTRERTPGSTRRRSPGRVYATRDFDRPGRHEPKRGFAPRTSDARRRSRPSLGGRGPSRAAEDRPRRVIGETASGVPLYEDDYYRATPQELGMRDFSERYGRYSGGSPYSYEYSERTIQHQHPLAGYDIGFTRPFHAEGPPRFPTYGREYERSGRGYEGYGRGDPGYGRADEWTRRGRDGLPRSWW